MKLPAQIKKEIKLLSKLNILCLLVAFSLLVPYTPQSKQPKVKAAFTSQSSDPYVKKQLLPPATTAEAIYILDLKSNISLFSFNPHKRLAPASLTKIATALVAFDYYQEDSVLNVNFGASSQGHTAELLEDDQLLALDTLNALLIPSGNDAAVVLAENYPGGYYAFVAAMNKKAQSLDLKDTHFSNVSGVESVSQHYTSAYDITMLAKSLISQNTLSEIVSKKNEDIKSIKGNIYHLETTNVLLGKNGVEGIKTGWTPEAGECLVTLVNQSNHPVIISVLGSRDRFGDSQKLIDWAYQNFGW